MIPTLPPVLDHLDDQTRLVLASARQSHKRVADLRIQDTARLARIDNLFGRTPAVPPSDPTSPRPAVVESRPSEKIKRVTYRWSWPKIISLSAGLILCAVVVAIRL